MERHSTSLVNIHRYAFYLLSFTIPLNQFISTRILLGAAVISLFTLRLVGGLSIRTFWGVLFYFNVLVIGLIYSSDLISGLRILETSFPLVVLPIAAGALSTWTPTQVRRCFESFVGGVFIACLICLGNILWRWQTDLGGDIYAYNFTSILGFQPIYFAYFLIFGITYILFVIYQGDSSIGLLAGISVCSILFISLLLTGTKTSFICLLLVFSFLILKTLLEERNRTKLLTTAFVLIMLTCMFIVTTMDIKKWDASTDAWERFALWESAFNAMPNILWGVGTGDTKEVLSAYYRSHELIEYAEDGLNAHNQLIQSTFSNGILGLISLVLMIAHPIYNSVRSRNTLALVSLFPFVIYGITEVYLGRYQGVVFWIWIHQTFMKMMVVEGPKILISPLR